MQTPTMAPPPAATLPALDAPGPFSTLTELTGLLDTHRTVAATGERKTVRLPVVATIPLAAAGGGGGGGGAAGAAPPWPVVVLLGGFQSCASMYRPLARRLASHGYAVLQYSSPLLKIIPDSEELPFLGAACAWLKKRVEAGDAREDAAFPAPVPPDALDWDRAAVAGHSRGGKLAALHYARGFASSYSSSAAAAAAEGQGEAAASSPRRPPSFVPRFRACFLIDPVDNTPYTPEGPLYPSAVRALRELKGQKAAAAAGAAAPGAAAAPPAPPIVPAPPLACASPAAAAAAATAVTAPATKPGPQPPAPATPKVGIVAAGLIGPSNPEGSNWRLFAAAADEALPGSRTLVLPDAGHTSFMVAPPGGAVGAALLDAIFGGGKAPREAVLDRTGAAAVAWLDSELKAGGAAAAAQTAAASAAAAAGGDADDGGSQARASRADAWLQRLVSEGRASVYSGEAAVARA